MSSRPAIEGANTASEDQESSWKPTIIGHLLGLLLAALFTSGEVSLDLSGLAVIATSIAPSYSLGYLAGYIITNQLFETRDD